MLAKLKPARTRIAPSPTGRTHMGTGRTALYDYLLARQTGGQFVLRIEDTDQKRYVPGAEEELIRSLRWLGLDWDEGPDVGGPHAPYHQSERKDLYQQVARQLIDTGHAYPCFCSPDRLEKVRQQQIAQKQNPRYDGTCRNLDPEEAARRISQGERHVIRFKMPHEGSTTGVDLLRGKITVENQNLDDNIIVKSDGLAVYHLAAMVDDHYMDITHVMRGTEWLPTFPLHVQILRALSWQEPEWVHLSLFLKPSGKGKMSKRDSTDFIQDGYSIFLGDLQELGYIPEGVLNWMALMGWSYDDHTEFFTLSDLIKAFSLDRLNSSPAAVNFSKLDHFNGLHIRALSTDDLASRLKPFFLAEGYQADEQILRQITPIIQERIVTLDEATQMAGFFFEDEVHPDPQNLLAKKMSPDESANAARQAYEVINSLEILDHATAEEPLRALAETLGIKAGQLFGILRVAVTGKTVSPPLLESMQIIGREKVLERIRSAIQMLEAM
ncbi:MAG TPA: glutamate--tRNA ligase [Anaerolineales bacterium]|nr:glutamate--tRNA ligase [Anaerolineales bacterium]